MEIDYLQPDFYRFNSDSIELAKFVASENVENKVNSLGDFFCGCGVIGIELILNGMSADKLIFLESNISFIKYIKRNQEIFFKGGEYLNKCQTLNMPFNQYNGEQIDLIVANPPYFYQDRARVPRDSDKLKARFFNQTSFYDIVAGISRNLTSNGLAYILYRREHIEDEKEKVEKHISIINKGLVWNDEFYGKTGLLKIF